MNLTRPGTLAVIFVSCALLAWLAVRATFENLPLLPVTAIPALAALAIAETVVARNIRGRLAGRRPGKPVAPIAVARLVALAKASSAAAAALGGLAGGYLAYVLGLLDKTVPARDARVAGATLAAAIVLLAAATYLERSCRDPNPPDDDDSERDPRDDWQWHS
ncbi:MAG: DUF3180 family protein [Streptosporangiaceae bacterium]